MKKRRCYLCGGKLVNGRCTLCGLDNTKIERKNYRLNESSFDGKGIEAKHLCESHNGKPSGGLNRLSVLHFGVVADQFARTDGLAGRYERLREAEWTKSAGTEFLAERTELDADGQEKEKVRKAEKGMDFNNHCIADDSDQYWRTGDQFCDDRDKK